MNDTTRRFLGELLTQVREEGVVELRLFPPLRQGGMESGLAVIAVEPSAVGPHAEEVAGPEISAADATHDVESRQLSERAIDAADGAEFTSRGDGGDVAGPEDLVEAIGPDAEHEGIPVFHHADGPRARSVPIGESGTAGESEETPPGSRDEPAAAAAPENEDATDGSPETMALGDILALPSPQDGEAPIPVTTDTRRLAILTARYKLTVRGPDRGRWDMDVVHEADAPLVTLDRVIKGVVRRSGLEAEPQTYSARSLREALDAPAWLEPE